MTKPNKKLARTNVVDFLDQLIDSGESKTIVDAIRKERGGERAVSTEQEELEKRKNILAKRPRNK